MGVYVCITTIKKMNLNERMGYIGGIRRKRSKREQYNYGIT